jgi:hypothetical protein
MRPRPTTLVVAVGAGPCSRPYGNLKTGERVQQNKFLWPVWNGVSWRRLAKASGPDQCCDLQMVYDEGRQKMLMYDPSRNGSLWEMAEKD